MGGMPHPPILAYKQPTVQALSAKLAFSTDLIKISHSKLNMNTSFVCAYEHSAQ